MIEIRRATVADIPRLQAFFRLAYGPATIFQDADFLRWFLSGRSDFLNAYVAFSPSGDVLSHYGWIVAELSYRGENFHHIWGVNAFTLPEARGEGIGKELVEAVREESPNFGVIGFTEKTAEFYASLGFNVFDKRRFERYVMTLDPATREILTMIGTDGRPKADLVSTPTELGALLLGARVGGAAAESDPEGLFDYCTTLRTKEWLGWRFSPRSQLEYRVRTHRTLEYGNAELVYRTITLTPTRYVITKIVDIYGDPAAASVLLQELSRAARDDGHLYIEFSSFAGPYGPVLERLGFVRLDGEDYDILPSLTNPIGHRPNREYIGLLTQPRSQLENLASNDVYFTLADSDRDRRGSIGNPARVERQGPAL